MLFELTVVFLLIYLFILCFDNHGNSKAPPGPFKIPPFGNLLQLALESGTAHLALHNLAKKYGDVMSLKMGLLDAVILSSYDAVRQVLNKEEALGRHCTGTMWDRNFNKNIGLVMSNEGPWQEMRSFCREALRKHGYGNRVGMMNLMVDELAELMKHMEQEAQSNAQRIVRFGSDYFNRSFLNVMLELVTGQRFNYEDEELLLMIENGELFAKNGLLGAGIVTAYPFLRHIFPDMLGHSTQMKGIKGYRKSAEHVLDERRKGDYKKLPKCFTDEFLIKIDEDASKPQPFYTVEQFALVFSDILVGGSETTSNVVNFILLYVACNQDIQEMLYKELSEQIGTNRRPLIEDKVRMPYTQAVLLEGLRVSRVLPLSVPRKALSDFKYKEFLIKKGTVLIANFHSLFYDEEFWGDPNTFRPERFFDKNGKLDESKTERIIPFGAGKRNCFGEVLARDSLFIFITSLMQKFHFKIPLGVTPNLEPVLGLSLSPHPYEAILSARKQT